MAPQMKGLVQFITDIRNATHEAEEDKRINEEIVHIQKQFQQPDLSGYHRKKYICKLLYMRLLGHHVGFGLDEAIELTRSEAFSEKSVGYLALNSYATDIDDHQWDEIRTSIDADFRSAKPEDILMALQAIVDLCDFNTSLIDAYERSVYGAIISPEFDTVVKKKAILAMSKFTKLEPSILTDHPEIAAHAIPLIDSEDMEITLTVIPLLEEVSKADYAACEPCITLAIAKLHQWVVRRSCPEVWYFHGSPAPWAVIKLFQLLEILIPDAASASKLDPEDQKKLREVLQSAVSASVDASDNAECTIEARNIAGAVLFGALSLSAHISPEGGDRAALTAGSLCCLLKSSDINSRYLALGALLKIAARNDPKSTAAISTHFDNICGLLRDRDSSIRRRALDLIYMTSSTDNIQDVCSALLNYLSVAEFSMKSEVAVKVAVLAETYATDASWFVMTILKLLSTAGNYVDEGVWCRMAQIVVNNDSIRPTACRTVVRYLKSGSYPQSMLKLAAFLLSEYGNTIESTTPSEDQFHLLHTRYSQTSVTTRTMLLSAFLKYYTNCPELRSSIEGIFKQESNSFNSEIQQRALEYLGLIGMKDISLLKKLTDQMPPFVRKESPLVSRLGTVTTLKQSFKIPEMTTLSEDKTGSKSLLFTAEAKLVKVENTGSTSNLSSNSTGPPAPPPSRRPRNMGATSSTLLTNNNNSTTVLSATSTGSAGSHSRNRLVLSPNWRSGYYRLCHFDQGILFENSLIRLVYRLTREKSILSVKLSYSNKSPSAISGLNTKIIIPEAIQTNLAYKIEQLEHPSSTIGVQSRSNQVLRMSVQSEYKDANVPVISISFISGGLTNLKLKLPLVLLKTLDPGAPLSRETFFLRWGQIGQALKEEGESQKVMNIDHEVTISGLERLISLIGFNILPDVDPNPYNIVAAGIINMQRGNSGCLMRLELNPQMLSVIRITCRCTHPELASFVVDSLGDLIKHEI